MRWAFAGIIAFLLLLSLIVIFSALNNWSPISRLRAAARKTRVVNEEDVSVWVGMRSGFYYCHDSQSYGKLMPGKYMHQGEALQRGYQPFQGTLCR